MVVVVVVLLLWRRRTRRKDRRTGFIILILVYFKNISIRIQAHFSLSTPTPPPFLFGNPPKAEPWQPCPSQYFKTLGVPLPMHILSIVSFLSFQRLLL